MESLVNQPYVFGVLLGLLLAIAIEIGQKTSKYARIQEDPHRKEQMVAIRDGLFVLVSLLLSFTLTLAVPRFNERRALVIEEADAIETTYLRASTLPQPYNARAQQHLRQYVEARLNLDAAGVNADRLAQASRQAQRIQEELWEDVTELTKTDRSAIMASYMSSLNEIIALHGKRLAAFENRIPLTIWLMIVSVALIAVFARGLTLGRRFWLTLALAPVTIALVVALIADLDTPSAGLIRLDDRAMQRLHSEIGHPQDVPIKTQSGKP
jgi:Protein of unknown function (DUF4239)